MEECLGTFGDFSFLFFDGCEFWLNSVDREKLIRHSLGVELE